MPRHLRINERQRQNFRTGARENREREKGSLRSEKIIDVRAYMVVVYIRERKKEVERKEEEDARARGLEKPERISEREREGRGREKKRTVHAGGPRVC